MLQQSDDGFLEERPALRGIMLRHNRLDCHYNPGMIRRRTSLSLSIAVGSTLLITVVAVVALCWA